MKISIYRNFGKYLFILIKYMKELNILFDDIEFQFNDESKRIEG